jgi:hypothetical protein
LGSPRELNQSKLNLMTMIETGNVVPEWHCAALFRVKDCSNER